MPKPEPKEGEEVKEDPPVEDLSHSLGEQVLAFNGLGMPLVGSSIMWVVSSLKLQRFDEEPRPEGESEETKSKERAKIIEEINGKRDGLL